MDTPGFYGWIGKSEWQYVIAWRSGEATGKFPFCRVARKPAITVARAEIGNHCCCASQPLQWSAVAPSFLSKIFGGGSRHGTDEEVVSGEKVSRRSTGFNEFIRAISREEGLKVLDLGATSPANITFMTGLGHKFHQEDVLRLASDKSLVIPNGDGGTTFDLHRYFDENLDFEREEFDAVMFWDLADFLPEPLVKPLIERIHVAMKPTGILFAIFHTKDAGPDAPFYRYNIAAKDTLEMQPARHFRLQRVFNNRHVENLFRDYASIKFFLGRDNLREVLVIR